MKTQSLFTRCLRLGALAALLTVAASLHATLRVWTGNGGMGSVWTNVLNWSGNIAPIAGDDLEFPDNGLHPNSPDNYTNGTTFNSIQFLHGGTGTAGAQYNLNGNSIALNAGVSVVNNSSTFWANTIGNALLIKSNQTFSTALFTSLTLFGAVNLNGNNLTFDAAPSAPIDVHAVISGAGGLIKTNPGTLTLYSNNTYTGSTIISGGVLALSTTGAISNSPIIALSGASANLSAGHGLTVSSGQTLRGIGSVSANVLVVPGGVISPGNNGLGTLTVNNNLNLNAGITLRAALNGTNTGTDYSQLAVLGNVALDNADLAVTLGYTPALGDSFVIITNGGPNAVVGTFNGLSEGTFFTNNGASFRISYIGGDGNDVVITRSNPTPSLIVSNNADSGAGSLRAVLAAATNGNTIVFATNVTGAIKLTTGELLVGQSVSILGPGPTNLAVNGNAANRVFHITNTATVFISGLTITNGAVSGVGGIGGGGVYNDHSTLTFSNCSIVLNNSSNGPGGAIYNDGSSGNATLSLIASTVSGNYALNGNGGAILNFGASGSANLSIITSTINNNSAAGTGSVGGGIFNDGNSGSASLTVTNSTFYNNVAVQHGGAIYNAGVSGTGVLAVVASTFYGNVVDTTGGAATLFNIGAGAMLQIGNTILKPGALQPNVLSQLGATNVSLGFNLCSDNANGFLTNTADQIYTEPMLGSLANNGGPTPTQAPLWGSPAIDKGKSFGLTTDQRGVARPYDFASLTNAGSGDGSDIGAVEFIPPAPSLSIAAVTNTIQLRGAGLSNLTYSIRANSNLSTTNWPVIGSAPANGSGNFTFVDTNATLYPSRFYRAAYP